MPIFGRLSDGKVLDVVTATNAAEAQSLFPAYAWTFVSVPEGTQHGAIDNGDGTYTNPTGAVLPVSLSKVAFMDIAAQGLGGFPTGAARFDELFSAAEASTVPGIFFVIKQFNLSNSLEFDKAAQFLDVLVGAGIGAMTQAEHDAILAAWPVSLNPNKPKGFYS